MTYDTNQLTRASAINMSIRPLLMEVAKFWQIGEKRVCTGGHESDGYPCIMCNKCENNEHMKSDLALFTQI